MVFLIPISFTKGPNHLCLITRLLSGKKNISSVITTTNESFKCIQFSYRQKTCYFCQSVNIQQLTFRKYCTCVCQKPFRLSVSIFWLTKPSNEDSRNILANLARQLGTTYIKICRSQNWHFAEFHFPQVNLLKRCSNLCLLQHFYNSFEVQT